MAEEDHLTRLLILTHSPLTTENIAYISINMVVLLISI